MVIPEEKKILIYIALAASIISGAITLILVAVSKESTYIYPFATIVLVFLFVFFGGQLLLKKSTVDSPLSKAKEFYSKIEYNVIKQGDPSLNDHQTKEIFRLKEMEKYRKEFLGNVSHELKTPIFNIQGYVSTLLDGGLEDPLINRTYLESADKNIGRMISIVEDLETITRLEAGELKLNKEKFDLVRLVEEVFETNEIRSKSKKIKLRFTKKYDKPFWVFADKEKIFQVISNLVINSIIYGKNGGKTEVSLLKAGKKIFVEVTDDGIGIAENDLPRIFERFYRADKSRSREQGGTGLGLAIVKHILEGHNETITVKSKENKGSTFTFTLPKPKKDKHEKKPA